MTGATANIGRATALAFAAEGARVVLAGRDTEAGQRVAELAGQAGAAGVVWHAADVTDEDAVAGLVSRALEAFGRIDVLVNNVGGNAAVTPFVRSTPAQWRTDLDLNLTSTLLCTHRVLPQMLERGTGRIVNIGSMAAIIGDPHMAVYSAAKGAVHAFTRVLALEVGGSGVTVNAIAPYGTIPLDPAAETSSGSRFHPETGLFARPRAEGERGFGRRSALPRDFARPEEIGAAAVYLASRHAGFITGQVLQIDGGVALT
ncbi:SDR family NAD(P)-dependent oxidoreductase [Actinoplanes sp. RD1]|uniref:SDR family NAD(P)-dependent oxidoreductase n=1 Tax=Actinoplanes sp. RD1 TaxID=3064538 RepID=UPI0027415616|nr:SDR family NAD(P)-dependent oxidoreductase [Actinoplanes sp. RD1]